MKTVLRKIGNSQGVLIPAPLLSECGITNEIEIHLEGKKIIIESARPARLGWFEGYQVTDDADAWDGLSPSADCEEWEW